MCHLSNDSKSWDVILYTCIVFSIALASVILRLIGKWASSRLSWDDAMVAGAILMTVVPLYFVLHMALNGFGEHLWNLDDGKLSSNLFSSESLSINS
jgi:putative Ca2+/H+ antiporter (TMEM165/GDT1 family)